MASPATTERFIRALQGAFEKSATDPRVTAVVADAFRGIQTSPRRACDVAERLPACAYLGQQYRVRRKSERYARRSRGLVKTWFGTAVRCLATPRLHRIISPWDM